MNVSHDIFALCVVIYMTLLCNGLFAASADAVYRAKPTQGVRAVVGDVGDGGLHALPPGRRVDARDTRLHQLQETAKSVQSLLIDMIMLN